MKDLLKKITKGNVLPSHSTGQNFYAPSGPHLLKYSPVDQEPIGHFGYCSENEYTQVVEKAQQAFAYWKNVPAPKRGEYIRQYRQKLAQHKQALGELVSYEMGKSLQEGLGEVQEMIDICDFAVGLSRQLYGLQMHSERPAHRMFEQWHPLGIVGIISAFNFPVAVWAWNAAIAWVCGNVCIWKPSEKTPFTAMACQSLFAEVMQENRLPEGLSSVILSDAALGKTMATDTRIALLSATGSVRMGKSVAQTVAARLGKYLLELGGNNAIIVSKEADIKQAVPAIVFGAVGTCGQRCTSTRRLIVHKSIYSDLKDRLVSAFQQLKIGDPLDSQNHVGPLIDEEAVSHFLSAIESAKAQGGKLILGGKRLDRKGCYVSPALIEAHKQMPILKQETFAPLLYLIEYENLEEAIEIQNSVPQGLSSALFSLNIRETEYFLSTQGSDCGIANVNIGTSGAEIGGAFGGEKETGGGRESGSDAWKAYMRRQTCTINYGTDMPLAQGIQFNLEEE
ncbi:aldehyde dehydrogenase family protein [Marinilongibacter aquaticus]|uniref:L-piperidine-6-carboxylate dehydrogenase n=1 Tax=Marinilongibacter aquaticus TaxID=2975157 RepID=UPI0021BD6675|nr:aldehyde dehydrogenase family protein [Marinilongibacter aquaticus]UBM60477.1 aldehyde dehydrogenase family protein [Marinilongibacter aquaticus]